MTDSSISPPSKKATRSDLARLAGVSASTVSRAMVGSTLITAEVKKRVLQVASNWVTSPRGKPLCSPTTGRRRSAWSFRLRRSGTTGR